MDNRRRLTRKAAGILALAAGVTGCGWLGIHKFLLGRTREGILTMLVTVCTLGLAWKIMCLVSIIEGLIYLTMSDEQFEAKFGPMRVSDSGVKFVQASPV